MGQLAMRPVGLAPLVEQGQHLLAMHTLVGELAKAHGDGKILAVGVSNFDEKRLREAHAEPPEEGIAALQL